MCSILLTNKNIPESVIQSAILQNRGPDHHKLHTFDELNFVHYLLNVTGDFTAQPRVKDGLVCMFNGEIYNYLETGDFDSEVDMILAMYEEHGEDFPNALDGEFAICLADFNKGTLFICTDPFATKPLYFVVEGEQFGVCTYKQPLQQLGFNFIRRCEPNSLTTVDLKTLQFKHKSNVFSFNLNQHKTSYDDWHAAFFRAVEKRFAGAQYDVVLPLSSGHDSGAISCVLDELNIPCVTYSYRGYEHLEVLLDRLERRRNCGATVYEYSSPHGLETYRRLVEKDKEHAHQLMLSRCANFSYGPDLDESKHLKDGMDDIGAKGLCFLLDYVKSRHSRTRILASGQGGDEIMGTLQFYGFGEPNPEKFPSNLSGVFPWQNFYLGAQSSYLLRDESISGGFGIEGRYPFLDKKVVQEFLWLKEGLKNNYYKSPIRSFLQSFNYPFCDGEGEQVKRGFNV